MLGNESFSFHEGQDLVLAFEKLLNENGIHVLCGSDLENKFLSVFEVLSKFEDPRIRGDNGDYRLLFREFSALYDLALKIMSVKNHKSFPHLIPHLKKLSTCNSSQNSPSPVTDQDANKIIELYLAALCMKIGSDVDLDDPDCSKGNNPDVLATINGTRWGFACKTIHTTNSQTLFDNIKKAVDQIQKSDAETGIVVINAKNMLPHDKIWPLNDEVFPSTNEPLAFLHEAANRFQRNLEQDIGIEQILAEFKGKKALPGVVYIAQSVSSVFLVETSTPIATRLNTMFLQKFTEDNFSDNVVVVLGALNHHMQLPSA